MGFVQQIMSKKVSPQEAAISSAVRVLILGGHFSDADRAVISLVRDQFPPLIKLTDPVFDSAIDRALDLLVNQGQYSDMDDFVKNYLLPAVPTPQERQGVYQFSYVVGMSNLNIGPAEGNYLQKLQNGFGLPTLTARSIENSVNVTFDAMYKAIAVLTMGLIVVTADGEIRDEELLEMQASRKKIQVLALLDDDQFMQMYNLALRIYNRYLTQENNRLAFIYNVVPRLLNTQDLRTQAFHYGAAICTSDGDVATDEVKVLTDLLHAFNMKDKVGEAIFNQYMDRVHSIDGRPLIK